MRFYPVMLVDFFFTFQGYQSKVSLNYLFAFTTLLVPVLESECVSNSLWECLCGWTCDWRAALKRQNSVNKHSDKKAGITLDVEREKTALYTPL